MCLREFQLLGVQSRTSLCEYKCKILIERNRVYQETRVKKAYNAPIEDYDHTKFISLQASRRYISLAKNKDFFKEKGFDHSKDFFQSDIVNKGL